MEHWERSREMIRVFNRLVRNRKAMSKKSNLCWGTKESTDLYPNWSLSIHAAIFSFNLYVLLPVFLFNKGFILNSVSLIYETSIKPSCHFKYSTKEEKPIHAQIQTRKGCYKNIK